jgi:cation diffusion facilitator CzcD-associated flavoprotein CzcO
VSNSSARTAAHPVHAPDVLRDLDVAIIGAGFSGLYMLYRIRDVLKLQTRVFEAADGPGGTWYWNRYPGARCDSESHVYSYSFSKELEQEWEWSSRYPEQPEILRYLNHVADRFDLRRDIQFETRITSATFDEARDRWQLTTDTGESISAQFVVTAVGCLSRKNTPDFPGLEDFRGEWYHTGAWPHEGVDFAGKRVGLIGTGSTGIQATPVIAAQADHLTVFQRTANYSIPARNEPLTPEKAAEIKAHYDEIRKTCRDSDFGFPYALADRPSTELTLEEQQAVYRKQWDAGGFRFFASSFTDLLRDKAANDVAADFVRNKIREIVEDPATAELLCPVDHPYGTKRPPIDTDYYETFNRDNVSLVDVRKAPIVEITPSGLRTEAGEHELDALVFATGFDAMTGALLQLDIRGVDGLRLADAWSDGPRTYLGLQVVGFPNLFTITGPGSPSVLTNMPVSIEQHVEWVSDCIEYLRRNGLSRIEATEQAQEEWVQHVWDVASETLFPLANSWYMGANIPGKTRVFMPYVGGMVQYRERCDEVVEKGYAGFALR